jgi:hypothetical protein
MQGGTACVPSEQSCSGRIWLASKQDAFISMLSLVSELRSEWGPNEADAIARELPRNIIVYAIQEGMREKDAVELPCVRAADLYRLPTMSITLNGTLNKINYEMHVEEIQQVLLLHQHPSDLVVIPMQKSKKQKRYDRVQVQKVTDPDYYTRKREYERVYRKRLRDAARHMSAENLQKLQTLSEADRDACLPFMH